MEEELAEIIRDRVKEYEERQANGETMPEESNLDMEMEPDKFQLNG